MDELDKILNTVESKEINDIVGSVLADSKFEIKNEMMDKLPYMRKASINDIVPEVYQHKLMEIDLTMSQCYWIIGDIAADLINSVNREKSKQFGKLVSRQDIYEAVGFFCHRTARSVRYYWETAHYFPLEVRQKYDVPFNVYSEARWVKDWELLLQIAEQNPIWSAERVRSEYHKQTGEIRPVRLHSEEPSDDVEKEELPLPEAGEKWQGKAQVRFRNTVLSKLEHTVDELREVIVKIPLPESVRSRIMDVILEIQDIELEVRREG